MTRFHSLACFALLAVLASSGTASAQALRLSVRGIDEPGVLGSAIATDLGRPVELGEEGEPRLDIALAEAEATLVFRAEDGSRRERTIEVSGERDEVLRVLTLIATNLVREQSEGLIAAAEPEAVPEPEPLPRASAGVPDVPAARGTLDAPAAPPEAPPEAVEESAPPVNAALRRPLSLGASGIAGLHVGPSGDVSPYGTYGLSLLGTVHEAVAIGVTRLALDFGYSSIESFLFGASATPVVEFFGFVDPAVQFYGQVGGALQVRSQTFAREGLVQFAPYVGAGVRFWATDWFTIGVELGVSVVATDAFLISGVSLPQGSVPGTLGLSVEFHIEP